MQNAKDTTNLSNLKPEVIIKAFQNNPSHTFLTITRNRKGCNYISTVLMTYFFTNSFCLCVGTDSFGYPLNIYKGMRLYLTHNLNKQAGIVNGESCVVESVQDRILLVQLSDNTKFAVHEISSTEDATKAWVFRTMHSLFFECRGRL